MLFASLCFDNYASRAKLWTGTENTHTPTSQGLSITVPRYLGWPPILLAWLNQNSEAVGKPYHDTSPCEVSILWLEHHNLITNRANKQQKHQNICFNPNKREIEKMGYKKIFARTRIG